MKRNHSVLMVGCAMAVVGRVTEFHFKAADNTSPAEWRGIDWGDAPQSLDFAEAKLSERLGLYQNPHHLDSIKDRHPNDNWRGKGNRRKVLK